MALLKVTSQSTIFKDRPGTSYPLGATVTRDGVNFAIYSKRADYMELLLFESDESPLPYATYSLSPEKNKTSTYWHIFLEGAKPNQVYAWRAYGPYEPWNGLYFDGDKVLIDPYSRGIVGWQHYSREAAIKEGDNCPASLRSVVLDCESYDWEDDRKPSIPYSRTVIYEMHVGGFTRHETSGVLPEQRGTFAALIEKLPYLKALGVTTLELMPVQAFDKSDAPHGMTNYWGYSPISFFAPYIGYSSVKTAAGALDEFRDMVKACHRMGMEVILDVVYNHTTENDHNGPTLCFKGLDNLTYYTIDDTNYSYKNFSGCGNTLRGEHPIVGKLIIDALRFWVADMHVDGFRFDLGSILSRDIFGNPQDRPPVLWAIESDSILASAKLILEAWDPAGLYQVGWFVTRANRFSEWNGPFRDDVRRFVKGDRNSVRALAHRISASGDIYGEAGGDRDPNRSINFVTCHDGFTMNDLVSYNHKHNLANGEDNRDGADENFSWNCGVEGATRDSTVEALRLRQIKNLFTILMFAQGTPMILMGDEARRSTGGNNNPYCQDNELNWLDWSLSSRNEELIEFVGNLISLSQIFGLHRQERVLPVVATGRTLDNNLTTLTWHGVNLNEPDFGEDSHSLAFEIADKQSNKYLYAVFNAFWNPLEFTLPPLPDGEHWHKLIDTAKMHPEDIVAPKSSKALQTASIIVESRSSIILTNTNCFAITREEALARKAPNQKSARDRRITWTTMKRPSLPQ